MFNIFNFVLITSFFYFSNHTYFYTRKVKRRWALLGSNPSRDSFTNRKSCRGEKLFLPPIFLFKIINFSGCKYLKKPIFFIQLLLLALLLVALLLTFLLVEHIGWAFYIPAFLRARLHSFDV